MQLTTYALAADFLAEAQDHLLRNEVLNSLLLGIAVRLVEDPHTYGDLPPYLATVKDDAASAAPGSSGLALCAVMTPPFNLILSSEREDVDEGLALVARDLALGGQPVNGVLGPVGLARAFAAIWVQHMGCTSRDAMSERLYELKNVIPPGGIPGQLRQATAGDIELVARWLAEFQDEATPGQPQRDPLQVARQRIEEGAYFIWDDGGPVSLVGSNRPTLHGISVGPVYTPPALRRRGYASACVAALSQRLLDQGYEYCALFTDLANPTSNAIYQNVGYRPVCDFQLIDFTPGS